MNVKHLILSGFLALSIPSFAQEATTVINKTDNVGSESGNALSTKINRATEKDIIKAWKSKMKDFDSEVKTKNATISATEVKIESIDPNTIEVFSEVRKSTDQEFELVVIFIKNGAPLRAETDLSGYTAAKNIVRNFANELSKEATENYQKDQVKAFEKAQKELEGAQKDQEKAEKAIADTKEAEATIKEKSKFLTENKKARAELVKKVDALNAIVKTANDEMELFK